MTPAARFVPAMPPTTDAPEDTPSKRQLCSVPALLPAMPPTVERLPVGIERPRMTRSRTLAPCCT